MNSTSETVAIERLLDEQSAAWSRGDLDGFMQAYWRDPRLYYASAGVCVRGWDALLDSYRQRYGQGAELGQAVFSQVEVELLDGDAAKVHGRFEVEADGTRTAAGSYTLVLRRFAGAGWRIVADQVSPEVAA